MKKLILSLFLTTLVIPFYSFGQNKSVDIILSKKAEKANMLAANELSTNLQKIYPAYKFRVIQAPSAGNFQITMGLSNDIAIPDSMKNQIPVQKEGFIVKRIKSNQLIITSHSSKGLFNAVYTLLEKLGDGFYLSMNTKAPATKSFSFKNWEMTDFPLQQQRVVFNWHNFLAGCTGWDYKEWENWIDQSAKMRYNTIMVHAYGNNPMFSFTYNGIKKDVGYLNTSNSGRDWGVQHVNDVRLLTGGEIFKESVFGSTAAKVPDNQREIAVQQLMKSVFKHAEDMSMKIIFSLDVDTWSSNPQNIIKTLPLSSRIKLGDQEIVNPDTPEGYDYYKAQLNTLLKLYPQINEVTLWKRNNPTLWNDIKVEQFPDAWAKEWTSLIKDHPELVTDNKYGASNFALSKIVKAFQKAVKELNKSDISISYGSWNWGYMPTADIVMPKDITFIPLDYSINFDTKDVEEQLAKTGANRKIVPIIWAHHDDHRFIGRPYAPYPNLNKLLTKRKVAGFGIIHWTTRPLDIYFKSLANQVWHSSEDEQLSKTLTTFCEKVFGSTQQPLVDYMTQWSLKGPMFGRETSDHFVDIGTQKDGDAHESPEAILDKTALRLITLSKVNQKILSTEGKKAYNYFYQMEQFYRSFFKNQQLFNQAYSMLNRKHVDSARFILKNATPEETIRMYIKASSNMEMTKGEKAIVFSMGTRWLPDYFDLYQRAKTSAILIKFGTTKHDPLAQWAGTSTFFIDSSRKMWTCFGKKELEGSDKGNKMSDLSSSNESESVSWIKFSNQLTVPLRTSGGSSLSAGEYKLDIKFKAIDKVDKVPFTLSLSEGKNSSMLNPEVSNPATDYATASVKIKIANDGKYSLTIKTTQPASLKIYDMVITPF